MRNGAAMNPRKSQQVFKIATRTAWDNARATGTLAASANDERDGYIHLSAGHQLAGTLVKHFNGKHDLVLIALDAVAFGDALRWERSRGEEFFPHLYALLPASAARAVFALELGANGKHIIPEGVLQ
jgi:uncharacterized protein (DUF952 family)